MANVFPIEFRYKANFYPALVSIRLRGRDQIASVQLLDSRLSELLPEGEVNFQLSGNLLRATQQPGADKDLIHSVREAVLQHLNTRI